MSRTGRRASLLRLHRPTAVVIGVLSFVAFLCGGYRALTTWEYTPSAPPDACSLVPEDFLAALTPDHGPPQSTAGTNAHERATLCDVQSPVAELWITIAHEGAGQEGGPAVEAHVVYRSMLIFPEHGFDPLGYPTPIDMADEAAYQIIDMDDTNVELWFAARMGAYAVQVGYVSAHLGLDDVRDSIIAVGREVLHQL